MLVRLTLLIKASDYSCGEGAISSPSVLYAYIQHTVTAYRASATRRVLCIKMSLIGRIDGDWALAID